MHKRAIALIGLSGVGKSTVGRALAAQLGWPLADTDAMVVTAHGRSVAAIFAEQGEPAFRAAEAAALAAALDGPPQVVATGGGVVLRAANRILLRQHAFVAWLDAPDQALLARLAAHAEGRPLLAADPAARMAALRSARAELYRASADLVLDTAGLGPHQVAARIRKAWAESRTKML